MNAMQAFVQQPCSRSAVVDAAAVSTRTYFSDTAGWVT